MLTLFFKRILFVMLFTVSFIATAQYQLSGKVVSQDGASAIENAEVYVTQLGISKTTDALGVFSFSNLPSGNYQLVAFSFEFEVVEMMLTVSEDKNIIIELPLLGEQLSEVLITKRKERIFALRQLREVEGTAIYAGKKTEVVLVENLTANLASGNARQIYSQVVGLNIYENNDAGLQLNIGGRGLNPNRSANFNTRQNGYDISADVLGYPESYYTPPAEAIESIEVVRGAASLQYGTQFGGLINFKLKQPEKDKKIAWISRQSLGSNDLFTSFNSLSGTVGKVGYYTYFNYKKGNDFRPNSQFDSYNAFAHVDYSFSEKTKVAFEFSYLDYLAQQPGGLTDAQFEADPTFSNRTRNWFDVNWKLYSLRLEHEISEKTDFSLNLFALDASRKSVGFRENRVSQDDDLEAPRELIVGNFNNWGAEARVLTRYNLFEKESTLLLGAKYYQSENSEQQGPGTNGTDANFDFATATYPDYARQSDFTFPNLNLAFFGENIFKLSDKFSVTPGFRVEYIKTQSEGEYKNIILDLAGNPITNETLPDNREFDRSFVLFGVGLSYKATSVTEFYGNLSQNYRSVTFNDIRIINPSFSVDPNITDEQGYTFDLGVRGRFKKYVSYDVGAFLLSYQDRLGVIVREVSDIQEERFRGNIGDAITYGIESFIDWNIWETISENKKFRLNTFVNLAVTESEYTSSQETNVEGKEVEFIPKFNLKTGVGFGYKNFLGSLQYTYLSKQFTDATNSPRDLESQSGIIGEIPAYDILDLSLSYTYNRFKLETGINNVLNNSYFTRRATGYPGPGILPSQPRTWYALLQFKLD
ncbi:TonB-dependent receptor [Patiriisocius marinistellae]|uniref:TonB-dependent receptor n=1 Tax=Patiriisocius marinistellae TaxID=2494560 RepID=A0A5J4G202_9FLAO|nr:TonB-dependent receptor [Patiriisocius marinistellae]GEQ86729.1 TonB-dependent receptor [Patiriisocius marinistellae]